MAPARLGPIYRRDMLSFMPYVELQKSRLVSRLYDSTIVSHPVSLQVRRRLESVDIRVRRFAPDDTQGPVFTTSGYVHDRHLQYIATEELWHKSTAFQQCCDEDGLMVRVDCLIPQSQELTESVKTLAERLHGQPVIPNHPFHDAVVTIAVEVKQEGPCVKYWARNEMSCETGAGLLHLLWHLGDSAVIERLNVGDVKRPRDAGIMLNPLLFELLSQLIANPNDSFMLRTELLLLFWQFPSDVPSYLKLGTLRLVLENRSEVMKTVELAIRLAANVRHLAVDLSCLWELRADEIVNHFIEAFTSRVPFFGRDIVPKLSLRGRIDQWPSRCPPKEGMVRELVQSRSRTNALQAHYHCRLSNSNSGETFGVTLSHMLQSALANGPVNEILIAVMFDFRPQRNPLLMLAK